jgi:hypothetical protein
VREQNTSIAGSPFQNGRIGRSFRQGVLRTDDIERRLTAANSTNQIAMHVGISGQSQHGWPRG